MILRSPELIDAFIEEYLTLNAAVKSARTRQDEIKLALKSHLIRREVDEIVSYLGTVKRIHVDKSVSFPGASVFDLASVWHVSKDAIFQQCGSLLMNLANFRPARDYLRITAPKRKA